jgi:hypothetical protein
MTVVDKLSYFWNTEYMDDIPPKQEQPEQVLQPSNSSLPPTNTPSLTPESQKLWNFPKWEIVSIAFVIVIIFFVIGFNAVTRPKSVVPSPTSVAAPITPSSVPTVVPTDDFSTVPQFNPPTDWEPFVDSAYNLSFFYPTTFTPVTSAQQHAFLPTSIIILSSSTSAYTAPTYTQESIFSVSTDTKRDYCYKDPTNGTIIEKTLTSTIGTYYVTDTTDAGAGNRYHTKLYRILHSNQCFELALTVHSATDGNGIDFAAAELSQTAAMRQLEQMVGTFSIGAIAPQ